jgi:hypothetical protein
MLTLDHKIVSTFPDVSVWSSTGNTVRSCLKRHPVTSATGVRVRIDDERAGPPPSSIHTYKQSWISTTTTTTPLGNAPETYHRCFANVNGPQYYYFSSQIKPDDIDSCGLYCLYYFKRRHRGTWTQFYDLMLTLYIVMHCNCRGGGPARSSSIRTRTPVAEVTGWRFTFPSWDPPNVSIRWETHRKLILSSIVVSLS